jgi:hypothetical protein
LTGSDRAIGPYRITTFWAATAGAAIAKPMSPAIKLTRSQRPVVCDRGKRVERVLFKFIDLIQGILLANIKGV